MDKKVTLHKKKTGQDSLDKITKDRMLWLRLPPAINSRFIKHCERLSCHAGTLARMAIIRFMEEEERRLNS